MLYIKLLLILFCTLSLIKVSYAKDTYYEPIPKSWNVPLNLDGYLSAGATYCTVNGKCLTVAPNLPDCVFHPDTQVCQNSKIPIKLLATSEQALSVIVKVDGHNYIAGNDRNWYKEVRENEYMGGAIEVLVNGGTIPFRLYNVKIMKNTVETHAIPYKPQQAKEVLNEDITNSPKLPNNSNKLDSF